MVRRLMPDQREFASALRSNATDAERVLWQWLRSKQIEGMRFRRQHPIGRYFADFACVEAKLIVEVDGGQHNESTHDGLRDAWLSAEGWTVLRFWNSEVLGNLEGVLQAIAGKRAEIQPPPHPSPLQGEGANCRSRRRRAGEWPAWPSAAGLRA